MRYVDKHVFLLCPKIEVAKLWSQWKGVLLLMYTVFATDLLEYCVLRFQYAVKYMLRIHGQDVVNQQLDLMRLADIITLIYAMTAVLGRASRAYCTGIANTDPEVSNCKR